MSTRAAVVFGDVHGESAKLAELIQRARSTFGAEVDLYSLGDLIDRGPDSKGVIELCVREGVQGILGNHELWFREVAAGLPGAFHDGIYSKIMGGLATLRSYGLDRGDPDRVGPEMYRAMPDSHRQFVLDLPDYRKIEVAGRTYWLIHAGMSSDTAAGVRHEWQGSKPLTDDDLVRHASLFMKNLFFWASTKVREPNKLHRFSGGAVQLLGHVPVEQAIVHDHYIALDTGCGTCHPRVLSALVLHPDGRRELVRI